jgi:hypothetical protein
MTLPGSCGRRLHLLDRAAQLGQDDLRQDRTRAERPPGDVDRDGKRRPPIES